MSQTGKRNLCIYQCANIRFRLFFLSTNLLSGSLFRTIQKYCLSMKRSNSSTSRVGEIAGLKKYAGKWLSASISYKITRFSPWENKAC
ncbi:hypothetical protein DM02DRAFT_202493 [Periconia macrospinosa]|uniref:Uncharacterized protein n=1 Tax=Periconia macrospinosa TaxID=97972 RepID=A0A2V1E163_9PLEO|nr:hypothetical protein DM02DRAFT_202493 [Periconia macrospinosa]